MVFRNVYFHQLHLYKYEIDSSKKDSQKQYQKNEILNEKIQFIIDNELNEYNCIQVKEKDDGKSEVLEVINHDERYLFARLGSMKDVHQFQLRNRDNFKPDPIDKAEDQEIEVFTYLLLDRTNFIISYLKEQSAPSIQKLGDLLTRVFKEEKLYGEISSITIEDALPLLSKKDQIGTVNYKISIPPEGSEYFNQEFTGLSEKEYEALSNQKSIDLEVKLVVNRMKDSFESTRDKFPNIIKKIASFSEWVKVKAKNEEEYMQEYKIVDSPFTKRQKFEFDSSSESISDEIYKQLKSVYRNNREEIKQFSR